MRIGAPQGCSRERPAVYGTSGLALVLHCTRQDCGASPAAAPSVSHAPAQHYRDTQGLHMRAVCNPQHAYARGTRCQPTELRPLLLLYAVFMAYPLCHRPDSVTASCACCGTPVCGSTARDRRAAHQPLRLGRTRSAAHCRAR